MSTLPSTVPLLDPAGELAPLRSSIDEAVARVLDSGQFVLGPEVEAFEREAAAALGASFAVALNSGTDALLIALRAVGVGPGDEVVTSPFSFFATSETVQLLGATPIFVDIDDERLALDPELVEAAITPRTKALLPVHLYGAPAPIAALLELAGDRGLALVEDAAQAFGARVDGRALGTFGAAGAFSFYPTKNLGAYGDGGMLTTEREEVAAAARALRNHGGVRRYEHETLGYNSRLDALQAAMLRVKLPHLEAWTRARRALAARYDEMLADEAGVRTPAPVPGHVYHQYTVRLVDEAGDAAGAPAGARDAVAAAMRDEGVATMVYYPSTLDAYGGRVVGGLPRAAAAARSVLSLPIYPTLGEERQDLVVAALRRALRGVAARRAR